jgi:tetratricopeptide (TPR) repeat protein
VSLQRTVELNPRHFEALEQLGEMLEDYGDKAGALKMYRRAKALDPQYEGLQRHIDGLSRDVEGQGI